MPPSLANLVSVLSRLRHPLALVYRSAPIWTVLGMVLVLAQAVLPLAILYLLKLTVDAVATGITATDKHAALQEVLLLVACTGLVGLLNSALRTASALVEGHKGELVTDHVTDTIHRQSVAVDVAYYEDPRYHDTFFRAQQEAPLRPNSIVQGLTALVQNSISLFALAGLLLYLHWGISLTLFLAALPWIVVNLRHSDRLYRWHIEMTATARRSYDYHHILTNITYSCELRLFDLGDLFRERYQTIRAKLRGERFELAKKRSLADLAANSVAVVSLLGMVVFVVWQTLQGKMTMGDMVMYQQAFQRAQEALRGEMSALARLYEDNLFLKNYYGFLALPSTLTSPAAGARQKPPRPLQQGVVFSGVSFRYPGAQRNALDNVNFSIAPGEVVALVGDNGAGKTTIAKLLCGLYEVQAGTITLDGIDYKNIDSQLLRREITMIFQDYVHYPLTARENIWLGDTTLNPHDPLVERAAREVGGEEVIRQLPYGYETMLGKRFTKGEEISSGEWQKLALARAFLRDAQLIILDEPASSLSARSEYSLFASFRKLLRNRAALLISHRFSTVRIADKICVLENGKIVEQGHHDELMRLNGRYAAMYEMQAGSYR